MTGTDRSRSARLFSPITYNRQQVVCEAAAVADTWIGEWVSRQPDAVIDRIVWSAGEKIIDGGGYLEGLSRALLESFASSRDKGLPDARTVDPEQAHATVACAPRIGVFFWEASPTTVYFDESFWEIGPTTVYFEALNPTRRVPQAVMELAWPEHENRWEEVEKAALARGRERHPASEPLGLGDGPVSRFNNLRLQAARKSHLPERERRQCVRESGGA